MSKKQQQARASEAKPMSDEAKAASDEQIERCDSVVTAAGVSVTLLGLVYNHLQEIESVFAKEESVLKRKLHEAEDAIFAVQRILDNCEEFAR